MSPKSTELLNNALSAMEMNGMHLLNWGSTRMAGFFDACMQALKIIVPFLGTITPTGIRPDETKYIASPKGKHYFICLLCVNSYLTSVLFIHKPIVI